MASIEAEFIIPCSNVLYNIYGIIVIYCIIFVIIVLFKYNAYIYKRCLIIHY